MDSIGSTNMLREPVRQGVERMRKRRKADVEVARLAVRNPENIAKGLILLAQQEQDRLRRGLREQDRLRRGLREQFGFSVLQEGGELRFRFDQPRRLPQTRDAAALWSNAVVRLLSYGEALRAMHHV